MNLVPQFRRDNFLDNFQSVFLLFVCYDQDDSFQTLASSADEQAAPKFGRAPSPRSPSSPWMPFSMLFAAISTKVPQSDMDLLNEYYEDFKVVNAVLRLFLLKHSAALFSMPSFMLTVLWS